MAPDSGTPAGRLGAARRAPVPCQPDAGLPVRSVALVSTYPPTACGIATFTANLRAAIAAPGSGWRADVVRILAAHEPPASDDDVVACLVSGDPRSLRRSLALLARYDAVLLQHEFRMFGGRDGRDVLGLIQGIEVPLVVVLHTVPSAPGRNQRDIIDRLVAASSRVVVQAEAARERLVSVYRADRDRVDVIAHGAAANLAGPALPGVPRPAVLTWGLLRPGKGLEYGIAAVARLAGCSPAPWYVIAGQTHPKILAAEGERYRDRLRALAAALGVADRVVFAAGYRDRESLRALVRSADVVLLPYENRDQVSSGVLVEALAAGKPVVATRFPHARELLGNGAGLLVDHDDDAAMAAAIRRVLYEPGLAGQLSAAAWRAAAALAWQPVGERYRAVLDSVVQDPAVA